MWALTLTFYFAAISAGLMLAALADSRAQAVVLRLATPGRGRPDARGPFSVARFMAEICR